MLRSEKERLVEELTERLRNSQTLIVTDYRGLSMTEIDELRGELLKHGARFSVVKNTLTRRAAEAAGADVVLTLLEGPTAIAFLEADGDPIGVAKALNAAARETRVLEIRGGVMEGSAISEADVQNLAKLPSADVLRGQVVGALAGPATTVVGLFTAPLRDLVGVLDARIRQVQEAAAAAEAPVRESGPGDGVPGDPGGSPADEAAVGEVDAPPEAEASTAVEETEGVVPEQGGDAEDPQSASQASEATAAEVEEIGTGDEPPQEQEE